MFFSLAGTAYLSCASGEMVVKINFSEPFRGITYVDYDKTSPCKFYGDGSKYYELRIPLKGCGTKQEAPRVFINNIIVRFHRSLELEEDEIKTIICRYPPPLAPPPTNVIAPILEPPPILPATKQPKLSEIELLLIICALLFLTLLLLGIGIAYYCLKKRNIKVVKKKKAISSAPASEITKLSGSTMGTLSMFDPIRIPRAMAASTSGSEAALLTPVSGSRGERSETIPSDYPSESPSSVSDAEEVVEQRASISSFQQLPMILKTQSAKQQHLQAITESEDQLDAETVEKSYAAVSRQAGLPPTTYRIEPPVYTKIRKKEEPRPPSIYGSIPDNDNRAASEIMEAAPRRRAPSVSTYAPSLYGSIPDNDDWSHSELEAAADVRPLIRKPKITTQMLTDYLVSTQNVTDVQEDVTKQRQDRMRDTVPRPPSSPPPESEIPDTSMSEITAINETAVVPRRPKITVKNIDEVFVTTEHETIATEHVVKRTRDTTEQLVKVPQSPPSWDVTIRHYPPTGEEGPQPRSPPRSPPASPTEPGRVDRRTWETITELTDATATTTATHIRTGQPLRPEPKPSLASITSSPPQWDVMNRVLSPPPIEGVEELTPDVKRKWRTLVTVDDIFRTLVHEATTTEEYIRISHDVRYESYFERRVWDVIIRILTQPDYIHPPTQADLQQELRPPRYRKNLDQPRRKSSLPPV
uniref:Papillote n=1 Tax=Ixodes scapularis TaxID=6945 RepID=A0A1S4LCN0_IXOSC